MSTGLREVLEAIAEGKLDRLQAPTLLRQLMESAGGGPEPRYPLSRGQAALWAIQQGAPSTAAYNLPLALRLRADADPRLVQRALSAVIRQHAALRTNVKLEGGDPVQVAVDREVTVEELDMSHLTEHELVERLREMVRMPFDLERDPLYRVYFVRAPWDGPLLLLVFHHMITDGVSNHLLLRDLVANYESLVTTGALPTSASTVLYSEFVRWQREMQAGPAGEKHRRYWTQKLAGASSSAVLDRLVDRRRGELPSYDGRSLSLEVDGGTWDAVRVTAREHGVTPFSVLFSAFVCLLHRHSQQEDICVMVPTEGRPTQAFEQTVGFFINTIVLRILCSPSMSSSRLFRAVHQEMLEAQEHADYPFAAVVDELRKAESSDSGFDVAFYLQQGVGKDLDMAAGQTLVEGALGELTQEGEFDLVAEVVVRDDHAIFHLKYDPQQFERATIERLTEHYREALVQMIEEPDRELGAIALFDPRERELVRRANATDVDYPCHLTAVDLIAAQSSRTPEQVAVVDAKKRLTYRELEERAERLAEYLRKRGIVPGSLVGLLLDRRVELIVAMLAVHRAGCAYVPLDPSFPEERLRFIVADAEISTVITDTASSVGLPDTRVEPIVLEDLDWTTPVAPSAGPYGSEGPLDERLAYVIYTSGSTGVPKGVEISHASLVNFLLTMAERPGCSEHDHLLAVTTVSFDIAALELLLPLTRGATVEIVPGEVVRDGIMLREWLEASTATMVQATPATWQMLLAAGWDKRLEGKVLCGGEALTPELADKLLNLADEVWNMYGPTETTIWSSVSQVRRHQPVGIGTPIANTRFYLLDEHRRLVPFGTRGELYIGGQGVARGYRGRPELTAEKFLEDPFRDGDERVFRTGDVGRYFPDGNLELLGRMDRQVKIRGYRVELGEIEANLRKSGLVKEARVLLREGFAEHRELVAFVLVSEPAAELETRLREHLSKRLPSYMVPDRLVPLKVFPETPNAKIDAESLRRSEIDEIVRRFGHPTVPPPAVPQKAEGDQQPEADPPQVLQEDLRRIVAEIAGLSVAQISPERPIGDYGFDSIRFTHLSARLRELLDVTIAPTTFYRYPNLDSLATYLVEAHPEAVSRRCRETSVAARGARLAAAVRAENENMPPGGHASYASVAIIGIGARLPESETLEEFWAHLAAGRDLVRGYPLERGFSQNLFDGHGQDLFRGAFLNDVEGFDAPLFRISPREAAQMDPQHRLLLQVAREAMEDSGCVPSMLADTRTGVFVGLSGADYFSLLGYEMGEMDDHFLVGTSASIASNRISYQFNLRGPSATYDTACSSSLVAIHRAVRTLQLGDCDMALAGGANLLLAPYGYLGLHRAGMLSPDSRCKTFDERADGYGRGEGVVLLLLKRLDQAQSDGDPVHGVIIGSAENHGGRTHSLTVPNPRAQTDVLIRAHEAAGISPASVGYIEAHGTGTRLGDPIEVDALKDAFAHLLDRQGLSAPAAQIGLGSVKTNTGHLEAAAGVAGVVKVLLAMRHRTLPGLVHLSNPNPMIDLAGSPFHLQARSTAWEPRFDESGTRLPRRAGVSSFGMGGSNVHLVLEEATGEMEGR